MLKRISLLLLLNFSFYISSNYFAAGILPYAKDKEGKIHVLLGSSSVHHNQLSDFGGLKDKIDNGNPLITASREACEELLFIIDNDKKFDSLFKHRQAGKTNFDITHSETYNYLMRKLTKKNIYKTTHNNYYMYFIKIKYDANINNKFQKRKLDYKKNLPKCWNETVYLYWIPLEKLANHIKNHNYKIDNDKVLYSPFCQSLQIAIKSSFSLR